MVAGKVGKYNEFDNISKKLVEFLAETRMMFLQQSYDLWLSPTSIQMTLKLKINKTELMKRLKLLAEKKFISKHKEEMMFKVTHNNISKYNTHFE
jgi:hypothetical protein